MSATKSPKRGAPSAGPNRSRPALVPQRSGGRERVAALFSAAANVIHERGYYAPNLARRTAKDTAVNLLKNLKTMAAMTLDKSVPSSSGSPNELRLMNRLYLASKLAELAPCRPRVGQTG